MPQEGGRDQEKAPRRRKSQPHQERAHGLRQRHGRLRVLQRVQGDHRTRVQASQADQRHAASQPHHTEDRHGDAVQNASYPRHRMHSHDDLQGHRHQTGPQEMPHLHRQEPPHDESSQRHQAQDLRQAGPQCHSPTKEGAHQAQNPDL